MRILLLTPIHNEKEYYFLNKKKNLPEGQAQRSWVETLSSLGHKVDIFLYSESILIPNPLRIHFNEFMLKHLPFLWLKYRRFQEKFFLFIPDNYFKNLKLLFIAFRSNPEVLFISGGINCIFPSTIKLIKIYFSIKVVLFSGVNPQYAITKVEKNLIKRKIVDVVVENDRGYASSWQEMGAPTVIVLPISGVDTKIHRRLNLSVKEEKRYKADVVFIGTLLKERQKTLTKLLQFNLKIWGDIPPGQSLITELEGAYQGTAHGEKMVKIFNAAKIVLNFQPPDMTVGGNMRTFEIPGCGAFQMVDKCDKNWFTDGREVVIFKGEEDLIRKIRHYLKNEEARKKISEMGHLAAYEKHTYENRFQELLRKI